jgi:hydroxypyruvate reductase
MVVLLSGGASAMMDAPAGGATLDDAIALNRDLLQSGLPIAEMNARRTQLSAIKGGQLALRAGRSITYAISDVHAPVEDDPAVIGSGPTFLREPVAGIDAQFVLAGSRRDAMAGASEEAARLGYDVQLVGPPTLGEARDAADRLVASLGASGAATVPGLSERRSRPRVRMSVIASGETTVRLPLGSKGRGGRNQEFALAAALAMTHWESDWALASIGTDGIDGPTNAAGAIVDRTTLARANDQRLDARGTLQAHNTYDFFERLGDLVLTGSTGTNVGDLQVLVTEGLGALG